MDQEGLVANNVKNILQCEKGNWSMPITRKNGHLYLTWNYSKCLFTRAQLNKLHLQFYHPGARKLFNLIKRSSPDMATQQTLDVLNEISNACRTCKSLSTKPRRFVVALPEDKIILNEELALDLMWLN